MAIVKYLLCSLLSILNLESCYVEYKPPAEEKQHKALFVFGDSLFDPGNNAYLNLTSKELSLYWPYGETFFHYPTGRYSDGRLVPDLIATLAGLPILPPYLEPIPHDFSDGANFASAGACVVLGSTKSKIDFPIQVKDLKHVVELLKKELGDAQARRIVSNAVYLISIGGVDYYLFHTKYPDASEATRNAFVNEVIGNLSVLLHELTNLGARKFAFQNLIPAGCSPNSRLSNGRCDDNLTEYAVEHNKALPKVLKKLENEVPGFRYSIFDYFNALLDRINNPHKYGFKEGQVACCGDGLFRGRLICGGYGVGPYQLCKNPFEYVWFDGGHNTEAAYTQFSELLWHGGPSNLTGPYTVQQLFQM